MAEGEVEDMTAAAVTGDHLHITGAEIILVIQGHDQGQGHTHHVETDTTKGSRYAIPGLSPS